MTVMPEYIQSEGIDAVLANVADRLGGTSVTTSPYVARESTAARGFREPPPDAGSGHKRLLDRPLWGKREVYMEAAPSFAPNPSLYLDTEYRPEAASELTGSAGPLISDFLVKAKERGLKTYLQVMAAIPPALRVQVGEPGPDDHPLLPDGTRSPIRVDRNATLASTDLRSYMSALITDLCNNYPDCDGFRFDWPEYPPYHFLSLFADYNPQAAPFAEEIGIDLDALAHGVTEACRILKASHDDAIHLRTPAPTALEHLRRKYQAIDDHFRLRAHLVESYAGFIRRCVDEASGGSKAVLLQGFPPPWNTLSGFDPKRLMLHADEIAIKFYTMHWPMIGANYVEHASQKFAIPERSVAAYFRLHFMGQDPENIATGPLCYPGPETAHGVDAQRLASAYRDFADMDAIAITHSYGPCDDVVARFAALQAASGEQIEINRYAYLSDEKIDAIAALRNP